MARRVEAEMAKIPRILTGRNKQKRFFRFFVTVDQNGRQMRLPWTLQKHRALCGLLRNKEINLRCQVAPMVYRLPMQRRRASPPSCSCRESPPISPRKQGTSAACWSPETVKHSGSEQGRRSSCFLRCVRCMAGGKSSSLCFSYANALVGY